MPDVLGLAKARWPPFRFRLPVRRGRVAAMPRRVRALKKAAEGAAHQHPHADLAATLDCNETNSGSARASRAASGASPDATWQVELLGQDTFDPVTMEAEHLKGADVPAWFLDTDYNGMVFRVRQAFFPRTGVWETLKKPLRVELEDSVWDHLSGTTSAPFPASEHGQITVKVIDPRRKELLVVKK